MKTTEMKKILHKKLTEENCYFKLSDIVIDHIDYEHISIIIKEYEHIPFIMRCFYDDLFGYVVCITDKFFNNCVAFEESRINYDIESALIKLGYYIGTRF